MKIKDISQGIVKIAINRFDTDTHKKIKDIFNSFYPNLLYEKFYPHFEDVSFAQNHLCMMGK